MNCPVSHFIVHCQKEMLDLILEYNKLRHGIIVQLPLPKDHDQDLVLSHIDPGLDVDCLHPANYSSMSKKNFFPCTATGIKLLIEQLEDDESFRPLFDKKKMSCCVIGRSFLVGMPIFMMLQSLNYTVTLMHSHSTLDLSLFDLIVSATGTENLITENMVKKRAIIFDVGGDCHKDVIESKTAFVTPTPGGIGKLTVLGIFKNLEILKKRMEKPMNML